MQFSLDLKRAEAKKDLRSQERAKMLGDEVKVSLVLPSGDKIRKTFRMGNLVEHLKVEVQNTAGIDFDAQELYLKGKIMADPLMLRDLWKEKETTMVVTVKQIKSKKKPTPAPEAKTVNKLPEVEDDEEYAESTDEDQAASLTSAAVVPPLGSQKAS
eukprot:CAMPEP_0167802926 /NCGR_PEP_ID=MMETSP0111_2-20121227/19448_1 /TAXON_ID=91324 /ORGANISM="Lotharella globosa, Strain CCCM811" /LENGTH=156 /DNA_ID=CAMNT_0007699131 /DNA_START=48 /DNA_END=518 /DNA_ORIENTATION=-